MALKIKSYVTDYGYEFQNIYCVITSYKYDTITKKLLFSIKPFLSEEAKNNGYAPLPIPALDLGCEIECEKDENMLEKAYLEIKARAELFRGKTQEEAEAMSLVADSMEEQSIKFLPFRNAVDC